MKATLVDRMGTDLTVVNAARVSFDKKSKWVWEAMSARGFTPPKDDEEFVGGAIRHLSDRDKKLIRYLAEHRHWSPFSHPQAQFHVKAPIFVARQLAKHQIGLAWNEVSRRYVDSEPKFYWPEVWRERADNVKQGSSSKPVERNRMLGADALELESFIVKQYKRLLKEGVCPEQARMILPQNMYTEWYWTGSLYAWSRICNLRLKPDAQEETRVVVADIDKEMGRLFPVSWIELRDEGSDVIWSADGGHIRGLGLSE